MYLVDFALCPDTQGGLSSGSREPKLPSLTSSILLQSFLPIISFPSFFGQLYSFTSQLEQRCREKGVEYSTLDVQRLSSQGLLLRRNVKEKDLELILSFVSERLETLLEVVSEEGFPLLLIHLFPFFQYPQTSFDAVYSFLPLLTQHMSRRNVERIFTSIVIRLFDTATEPHHRGQLYSRTTSDIILKRFGLSMFLNRFLGFLIEAVVEPMRLASSKTNSSKRHNSNIVRMKSQSILTLMTSDLLQSQVYNSLDGREMSANLSFSLGMSEHGYDDSDKEFSSGEESDDDLAECSVLAKSSVLSGGGEGELGEGGRGMPHSPLVMAAESASNSGSGSADKEGQTRKNGQPGGSLVFVTREEVQENSSRFSLLGSLSMHNPQKEPHLLSPFQDSVSLTASSQFDPTQSVASSEDSFANEIHFTSSLPPGQLGGIGRGHRERQSTMPMGMKLGLPLKSSSYEKQYSSNGKGTSGGGDDERSREDEGELEDEGDTDTLEDESTASYDPELLAVNLHVSEVAGDCLCWLLRRLGPMLSSKHIVRPLIEGLHRCFTGVLGLRGKEVVALKCLTSFAECYGETVVRKMYVPHAENMVVSAISRMNMKAEANVAASLGIVKVSIKILSKTSLMSLALVSYFYMHDLMLYVPH